MVVNEVILTFKQKLFVDQYISNFGNATKAAMKAYDCKNINNAAVIGCQNLRKLNVRREIDRILGLAGINEETIANKLKEKIMENNSISSLKLATKLMGYTS